MTLYSEFSLFIDSNWSTFYSIFHWFSKYERLTPCIKSEIIIFFLLRGCYGLPKFFLNTPLYFSAIFYPFPSFLNLIVLSLYRTLEHKSYVQLIPGTFSGALIPLRSIYGGVAPRTHPPLHPDFSPNDTDNTHSYKQRYARWNLLLKESYTVSASVSKMFG